MYEIFDIWTGNTKERTTLNLSPHSGRRHKEFLYTEQSNRVQDILGPLDLQTRTFQQQRDRMQISEVHIVRTIYWDKGHHALALLRWFD